MLGMNLLSMGMEKMPLSTIAGSAENALLLPAFVAGSQKQLTAIGAEQEKQGVGFALPA